MSLPVLSTIEFYTRVADYKNRLDPTWDAEAWKAQMIEERELLAEALGEANSQSVLDCSCGSGGQAIPLAKLGWQVTATDITEASLNLAKQRAREENARVDFCVCDMRDLQKNFPPSFDWVISCMAIDNLTTDEDIQRVIKGMYRVLK